MPTYIDIGAVRIQEWLARTPELRLRRGASAALSQVTGKDSIGPKLPAGVTWNDEAGDVDGIVNLRTASTDQELIGRVVADVIRSLRAELPALDWGAGTAQGGDYYSAYPQLQRSREAGELSPPPAAGAELTFVRPCTACGLDPASETDPKDGERICRDCAARAKAAGRATGAPRFEPAAARRLRTWLGAADAARFPEHFEDLARLDGETHIATVYADGNALGKAFGAAPSGTEKSALAQAIIDATREGVVKAVQAIERPADGGTVPVVVHTIGGDDLLVSVPPNRAWLFTRVYLEVFASVMRTRMDAIFGQIKGDRPKPITASAGVVHAHCKFPIGLQIEAAERAMRAAKFQSGPDTAAVAWLEVTADGHLADPHGPWPLSVLSGRWEQLAALAEKVPASQRARLLRLEDKTFTEQLRRMDLAEVKALGSGWGAAGVDEKRVKEGLRIVRWWS